MRKQLKALGQVSDMILDLKLANLQRVTQQTDQLKAKNAQLDMAKAARNAEIAHSNTADPALFAGQDQAWQKWIDQTKQERNIQLAQLLVERETRLQEAREALGRADVIKSLLSKHK